MFSKEVFRELRAEFDSTAKLIERSNTSKDPKICIERAKKLIETYNKIIDITTECWIRWKTQAVVALKKILVEIRDRLIKCFGIYKLELKVPTTFTQAIVFSESDLIPKFDTDNNTDNNTNNDDKNVTPEPVKMPQTVREFFALAGNILNYKYSGEPLQLETFLNDIALLKEVTEDDNKIVMVRYVKSKLSGVALEWLPEDADNIEKIIDALRAAIKTESSKVVASKLMALKSDKMNLSKFSELAEKLAEDFRRSLVVEGISKIKATEMAVDKTVELCRKNARSTSVGTIIGSAKFEKPSEVIAKYITEIDFAKDMRQNSQSNNNRKDNFRGKKYKNFGNSRGHNSNQYGHNSSNRGSYNGSYNQRGNGSNYRGRGRGNRSNGGNQNSNAENFVRFLTENSHRPSNERRAAEENDGFQGESSGNSHMRLS